MTFTVAIDGSDAVFPCGTDETVLDAAERAGYSIPYSCRKGVCSTCEGQLRRGSVTIGSTSFTGPDAPVLLCQAKPTSDILIHPARIERVDLEARKTVMASVYSISRPTEDVAVLQLRFPAGIRAKFRAGQYLRIKMPDGDTRNFSLANPPHESDGAQLHIRHVPGGQFSEKVLAALQKADKLEVELPYGDFYLRPDSQKPLLCLATGTGFAPLKSIVEDLIRRGNKRDVRLYWGGRHRHDLYMAALPEKWAARADWFKFVPVLWQPDPDWTGATGLLHQAVLNDLTDLSDWQVYACGNPGMIRSARRELEKLAGLRVDQFFADPFVASGNLPTLAIRPGAAAET